MQQALAYAETLDVPFVFSSNGDGFLFHDRTGTFADDRADPHARRVPVARRRSGRATGSGGASTTPTRTSSPAELRRGRRQGAPLLPAARHQPHDRGRRPGPEAPPARDGHRHGQDLHRVPDHLAALEDKTAKRILFLADRNILVDQTIQNDFKPFGEAMTKINRSLVDEHGRVDKSYEIYLGLYQAITGTEDEENDLQPVLAGLLRPDRDRRVPPRQRRGGLGVAGGARLLRLGHPARPDGHAEGDEGRLEHRLLRRAGLHLLAQAGHRGRLPRPLQGGPHRPRQGPAGLAARGGPGRRHRRGDRGPHLQPDATSTATSSSRSATKLVAERIIEFLHGTDPMPRRSSSARTSTTPSGCARRWSTPENARARRRPTTGTSCASPATTTRARRSSTTSSTRSSRYPVIATTSKLMTTGVDAQTCHLIVLDQRIQSMTEFKQIIGRGTRMRGLRQVLLHDHGLQKATELFADPDFDGAPIQIYESRRRRRRRAARPDARRRRRSTTRSTRSSTTPTTSSTTLSSTTSRPRTSTS